MSHFTALWGLRDRNFFEPLRFGCKAVCVCASKRAIVLDFGSFLRRTENCILRIAVGARRPKREPTRLHNSSASGRKLYNADMSPLYSDKVWDVEGFGRGVRGLRSYLRRTFYNVVSDPVSPVRKNRRVVQNGRIIYATADGYSPNGNGCCFMR